jgi:transposase InsO family protein
MRGNGRSGVARREQAKLLSLPSWFSPGTSLLLAALWLPALRQGCVLYSDGGTQQACRRYRERVAAAGLLGSVSHAVIHNVDALAESFIKTLKHERIYLRPYRTMDNGIAQLPHYLEKLSAGGHSN